MSKKIFLSPSNQNGNMYACGGTNEMEQCNRIADKLKVALERCGFTVKKAQKGQAMNTTIVESNDWKPDLHLCIHTNAGGGAGTMVMVYNKSTDNIKYAKPIYNSVQAVSPGQTDYGIKEYPELAELNSTSAIAVYCEVEFHDKFQLARWIINNTGKIAEAFCKGICEAFNVKYKSAQTAENSETKSQIIYRVQVGAFAEKKNADAYLEKVKKAGFSNAFITEVKK